MTVSSDSTGAGGVAQIPRWLPNAISVLRIVLVPVWWLFCERCRAAQLAGADGEGWRWAAAAALCAMGLSDVLDGWLARRFGLATRTGATLDAVADKLAQVITLTFLTFRGAPAFLVVPLWFWSVVILRDVAMLAGCLIVRREVGRVRVVHRMHGRLSSVVLFFLVLGITIDVAESWAIPAMLGIAAIIVLSTAQYVRDGWRQCRGGDDPAMG